MTHNIALGFDTSNYTTSSAFFDGTEGQNSGLLLSVPEGKTGLRQSDVLFQHVKQLPDTLSRLSFDHTALKAIGAATKPRENEGSYMPCFLAGASMAKAVAHTLQIPFFEFSHQQGHIAAAAWSSGKIELMDTPHLAWHLSGGTTELLYVTPMARGISCVKIGGSTDISAGQLIDRTGVKMGFSFPSGMEMDKLASASSQTEIYKIKLNELEFSLSGMENKANDMLCSGRTPAYTAGFIFASMANVLKRANDIARKLYGELPILYSGGVSSSGYLRAALKGGVFSRSEFSSDNALGIAVLAFRQMQL